MGQYNLDIEFGRIATSEKLPDRILNSGVVLPKNDTYKWRWCFYLIEISSPFFSNSKVPEIIKSLLDKYFASDKPDETPVYHFEHAIKQINSSLAELTKTGETDWVGALSAVIAVIVGRELLITQTGDASVYLFRKLKISHLTEGLNSDKTPHPLKTFSNLITGDLQPEDRLLIANQTLFDYVPLDRLRQLLLSHSPSSTSQILVKQLRREKVRSVNSIIIESIDPTLEKKRVVEQKSEVFLLDQPAINILHQAKKAAAPGAMALFSHSKRILLEAKHLTKTGLSKVAKKTDSNNGAKKPRPSGFGKSNSFPLISNQLSSPRVSNYASSVFKKSKGLISNFKYIPLIYITLAIALVTVSVIGIKRNQYNKNQSIQKQVQEENLAKVKNLLDSGMSATLNKDSAQARNYFLEAKNLAQTINIPERQLEITQLRDEAEKKLNNLDKVTLLPLQAPQAKFEGQKIDSIAYAEDSIFGLDKTNGAIWQSQNSPATVVQVASSANLIGGSIYNIDENFIIIKAPTGIYQFDPTSKEISEWKIKQGDSWPQDITDADFFANSLYLLSGSKSQIYKYSKNNNEFSQPAAYIKESSKAYPMKNVAIDGNVWTLSLGTIQSWSKGKLERIIDLKTVPRGADSFDRIFTDSQSSIFLTDSQNRRLVEIKKDGSYVRQQILSDSIGSIFSVTVDLKSKKAYFLANNSVYAVSL